MRWSPRVTVAAVVEQQGRFLLVEEQSSGRVVYNQPAGHLEPGESLRQAAVRETREETAWLIEPTAIVGIYRWHNPRRDATFLRVCFAANAVSHDPDQALDTGILRALWLSPDDMIRRSEQLRSPMVLGCVQDYLAGKRYSLDLFMDLD